MVAKTMVDKTLLFLAYSVLGALYIHLSQFDEARQIFDVIKDVAEETNNWGMAMQAYEWIGRTLQSSHDYENAIKAFKKMMQLSWVNNVPEFEVKSYHNLAKQNFYLQFVEKSTFYQERFLRGCLENPASCQRTIAEQLFNNKLNNQSKTDKYEKAGFTTKRRDNCKFIYCVDDYTDALLIINDR